MIELEALYADRRFLNHGYVFFDDIAKAMKWKKVLEALYIGHIIFVIKSEGNRYYGFKMLKIRKKFFMLCIQFKEVFG